MWQHGCSPGPARKSAAMHCPLYNNIVGRSRSPRTLLVISTLPLPAQIGAIAQQVIAIGAHMLVCISLAMALAHKPPSGLTRPITAHPPLTHRVRTTRTHRRLEKCRAQPGSRRPPASAQPLRVFGAARSAPPPRLAQAASPPARLSSSHVACDGRRWRPPAPPVECI